MSIIDEMTTTKIIPIISHVANDLINRIFEKNKFDAAYSRALMRNNDVKSAIVRKLYELYDPCFLLSVYEEKRLAFLKYLKKMVN